MTRLPMLRNGDPDFRKIFHVTKGDELRHNLHAFHKARDDDRQLDVANLSDEELDRLKDQLDDEIVYDNSGNRVRRSDLDKTEKEKPMGKMETLRKYVEASGMLPLAKYITDTGGKDVKLSEAQFTELATAAACKAHPDLSSSPDRAFAKYFGDHQVLREAHRVVKQLAVLVPLQIGGPAAVDSADTNEDDALEQIWQIVNAQRSASPEMAKLTPEAAFAKVYCDPANARLAQAERRQARARLG